MYKRYSVPAQNNLKPRRRRPAAAPSLPMALSAGLPALPCPPGTAAAALVLGSQRSNPNTQGLLCLVAVAGRVGDSCPRRRSCAAWEALRCTAESCGPSFTHPPGQDNRCSAAHSGGRGARRCKGRCRDGLSWGSRMFALSSTCARGVDYAQHQLCNLLVCGAWQDRDVCHKIGSLGMRVGRLWQ